MPVQVAVVTPEREMWSGEATFVRARSAEGDVGIMGGHTPFMGALGDAVLVIQTDETQIFMAVHGGFIEVLDDRVTVITGVAELAQEIDIERARRAQQEAEAALGRGEEVPELQADLVRATTRIRTAGEAGLLDIG